MALNRRRDSGLEWLRVAFVIGVLTFAVILLLALAGAIGAEKPRWPGMQAEGEILLPNQWSLRPTGRQLELGDFPVQLAIHPDGTHVAALHAGHGEHEIIMVDVEKGRVRSRTTIPQAFYGLCFDAEGKRLFASGAELEVVHSWSVKDGLLGDAKELRVAPAEQTFVPSGMACSADGKTLFVACGWGGTLCFLATDGRSEALHTGLGKDTYPYTVLLDPARTRAYVSLWGGSAVAVVDTATRQVIEQWSTNSHPTEMVLSPDGKRLFVSCANSNTVCVLDTDHGHTLEVISTSLYPSAHVGSTPNSLALSPDGQALFVANADNNNLCLFDVTQSGQSRSLGFIPVGMYPTSVRYHVATNQILVANGKGLIPRANRLGPQPFQSPPGTVAEYIGGLYQGTLSFIAPPDPAKLANWTKSAYECSPLQEANSAPLQAREEGNPIPAKVGDESPIKYCVYIIKENRTYDQVFGDIEAGNGDEAICLFPEAVTPNHHALAKEYVLLDNFYVEAEVSADGHEWTTAAYATDFVEKTWPLTYRSRPGLEKLGYPAEGAYPIANSSGGYIWDRCQQAGVTFRSYGEFIENGATPNEHGRAKMKALEGNFDPMYRGYDLDYRDVDRAAQFLKELREFENKGEFPRFVIMHLPNDHTHGMAAGKPTPTAMVADNDLALGQVIEGLSNSMFWKEMAVFVVEDDAQNGADHVDAHRTVALVLGPHVKRGVVDSTMYSTSSMLRTMELILGLEPMSQFDAAAQPMYASFQAEANATPYQLRPVNVDMAATNLRAGWGAEISATFDFSKEDAADDLLLNQVVWKSVKGEDSTPPAPVRAAFVRVHGEEEEEEEDGDDDEREVEDGLEEKATGDDE